MDGVNEPNENAKFSTFWIQMRKNRPLDENRKTGQTSGTKMTFYSYSYKRNCVVKYDCKSNFNSKPNMIFFLRIINIFIHFVPIYVKCRVGLFPSSVFLY
ncbi:hypothetical protein Hanom_Chr02g00170021 [Helianthus anomalus]